jgi:hypothetical protein
MRPENVRLLLAEWAQIADLDRSPSTRWIRSGDGELH